MHKIQLIALYCHICDWYDSDLHWEIQRFSPNNHQGHITDQELLTIYLYCIVYERQLTIKAMHTHIQRHWLSWFPTLPSYQTFNQRLNRLWPAMQCLIPLLLQRIGLDADLPAIFLGDSCPVITCKGTGKGKVAPDMTDKGYCASKQMHYFGVKLHMIARKRPCTLPLPHKVLITKASEHDLSSMRAELEQAQGAIFVLDKAYADKQLSQIMAAKESLLICPEKDIRCEGEWSRHFQRAYRDLTGTAVARVRQPIESLFAWIQEKTAIQTASKVRSKQGLQLHLLGKIAAAIIAMGAI